MSACDAAPRITAFQPARPPGHFARGVPVRGARPNYTTSSQDCRAGQNHEIAAEHDHEISKRIAPGDRHYRPTGTSPAHCPYTLDESANTAVESARRNRAVLWTQMTRAWCRSHATSYDVIVALPSRRLAITREAIEIVMRRLAVMPPSPEIDELRAKAEHFRREVDGWAVAAPTAEARDKLMKRVLKLHVEVARLERATRT